MTGELISGWVGTAIRGWHVTSSVGWAVAGVGAEPRRPISVRLERFKLIHLASETTGTAPTIFQDKPASHGLPALRRSVERRLLVRVA